MFTFNHHTGAVLRAEWSPSAPGEVPGLLAWNCIGSLLTCCLSAAHAPVLNSVGEKATVKSFSSRDQHQFAAGKLVIYIWCAAEKHLYYCMQAVSACIHAWHVSVAGYVCEHMETAFV